MGVYKNLLRMDSFPNYKMGHCFFYLSSPQNQEMVEERQQAGMYHEASTIPVVKNETSYMVSVVHWFVLVVY